MDERRQHSRQITCIPAYFESRRDAQDLALIRDASVSGARLYARTRLNLEEPVTLHLYLGKESDPPRKIPGKVVRVERRDLAHSDVWTWEIGVTFSTEISEYEREIEDLCRRQEVAGVLKR